MDTYKTIPPFTGAATAVVTPMSHGEIDLDSFRKIVKAQTDDGINAVCVCGTTGEAETLEPHERRELLRCAKAITADKVPLIAGCGSSDTRAALAYCRDAKSLGANALLIITPYCNKGTDDGIFEHYKSICAVGLPVILYNVPSRTGVDLNEKMCKRLCGIPGVRAIKEASGSVQRLAKLRLECPSLTLYSGNDDMTLAAFAHGGAGVISVLSNLVPCEVAELCRYAAEGNLCKAREIFEKYFRLVTLLFAETNPAPLKYAMSQIGYCSEEMRLPMAPVSQELKKKIRDELLALGMI